MAKARPVVVILDDDPDIAAGLAEQLRGSCTVRLLTSTEDVIKSGLGKADLILVDYNLAKWWGSPGNKETLLQAHTGVTLGLNIAEFLEDEFPGKAPIVALVSGEPSITNAFAPSLCQQIELDWVFARDIADAENSPAALAGWHASTQHRPPLRNFGDDKWLDFLAVPKRKAIRRRIEWSLEGTERPQESKTRRSHARLLAAWVLQRLKGYPGPLWSTPYLYARLGLYSANRQPLNVRRKVANMFDAAIYSGPLSQVDGVRWWKTLVEQHLEHITAGASTDPAALRSALKKTLPGARFQPTDDPQVVLVERSGRPTDQTATLGEAVRVLPSGWPSNADPAFMLADDIEDDHALLAPYALPRST